MNKQPADAIATAIMRATRENGNVMESLFGKAGQVGVRSDANKPVNRNDSPPCMGKVVWKRLFVVAEFVPFAEDISSEPGVCSSLRDSLHPLAKLRRLSRTPDRNPMYP